MLNQNGVSTQPLEVDDFSGGMTDNYLSAPANRFETADNLYLIKVGNKAKLSTRPALRTHTNVRIPTNKRINNMFDIEEKLFQISNKRLFHNTTSAFTEALGPSSNALANTGDEFSFYSVSNWNKHAIITNDAFMTPQKLFNNGTNWVVHNLGLPMITNSMTVSMGAGAMSFGVALHYYYQYSNQGVTFEEQGPILFKTTTGDFANALSITSIPVLSNGATENYDTANVKIKIFRTQNAGTTYFYLGEITNGTTSFSNTTADSILANNVALYTNGVDYPMHYAPPKAKVSRVVNDILCLGYAIDESSGQYIPNRGRFSNRGSLWSCPKEFYENFDEEIVGIGSINIYPIYFCKNKVYRIEGYYLPDGSGGVTKKLISSTAGCVSHNSIVQTDIGLFWCGNDGWYFTDGYNVTRISDDLPSTYLNLVKTTNQRKRIYGFQYPQLKIVGWCMQSSDVANDNDTIFCCHIQAPISSQMPFTSWSGGNLPSNFTPTSAYYVNSVLYQSDTNGFVLKYDLTSFSDVKIELAVSPSAWIDRTIIYLHKSCAFGFGSESYKKWVSSIVLAAENVSSISLQIYSDNDNSGSLRPLGEMSYRGNIAWGDYSAEWGNVNLRWNYFPIVNIKRRFPASGLRCYYKQLTFTNSFTVIESSTILGNATFNNTLNTITLLNPALQWPTDCLDYYVSSEADGYVNQYRITARSNTTLTVEDLSNNLPVGDYAWKIQGYQRNEILKITSYTLNFGMVAQDADPFRGNSA